MTGIAAYIVAARRTVIAPRGGLLAACQADELAAPVISALLADAGRLPTDIDHVVMGNALYGGGNPARMAALRAGLPEKIPAMTIDSQCCSGLDAILLGVRLIQSGAARNVIAGGLESFSQAPIRMHRPSRPGKAARAYARPPFSPWPDRDPDLAAAAARLAAELGLRREDQARFACASHARALAAVAGDRSPDQLMGPGGGSQGPDPFSRVLPLATALRAPVLAGDAATGLSAATIAVEADGAAAVLISADPGPGLRVVDGLSIGCDPAMPAHGATRAAEQVLQKHHLAASDLGLVAVMEAYAAQAMATVQALSIPPDLVNPFGGALARGHPIGASGAVLVTELYRGLVSAQYSGFGLCMIAAGGGLGSCLLVSS